MNRKFKLIKKYPLGPDEIGNIVSGISNNLANIYAEHPEFWEEVIEKDYQILSFKQDVNGYTTLRDNNYYVSQRYNPKDCPNGKGATLNEMLTHKNFKDYSIHSVKRLSDGEIFTIGDKCITELNNYGIITSFEIYNNELYLKSDKNIHSTFTCQIKDLIIFKKPLFTTADNVDAFIGDSVWIGIIGQKLYESTVTSNSGLCNAENIFKCKKNAENYLLMNEPCLSISDIKNMFKTLKSCDTNMKLRKLQELVKLKI